MLQTKLNMMLNTKLHTDFYQRHLDRVSRSFAYCIGRLESPLRGWVSLTYLICRVLDTVEDARWRKKNKQLESFLRFEDMVSSKDNAHRVQDWIEALPLDLPECERLLVQDSSRLFNDLHGAPETVREIIQNLAGTMARGMRHFVARSETGSLRLRNLQEVNQYCFFVAGVVGEALSRLMAVLDTRLKISRQLLINAHHFGLFLQKVNLLKDQHNDEREGRFLVTSRSAVYHSLRANAEGAMAYIEAMPVAHRGYRYFCATSFFLGLATLPLFRENLALSRAVAEAGPAKIDRAQALRIFADLDKLIDNPSALRAWYLDLMTKAGLGDNSDVVALKNEMEMNSESKGDSRMDINWIKSAYRGHLDGADFLELRMA